MLTLILVLNVLFVLIIVMFSVKLRTDLEALRKWFENTDELKIRVMALEERVSALEQELNSLNPQGDCRRSGDATRTKEQNGPPVSPSLGDLSSLIADLFKQGKREDEIASTLGLSLEEVKLALKVSPKSGKNTPVSDRN